MRRGFVTLVVTALSVGFVPAARAQECSRAVLVTTPSVIWSDIQREQPPNILAAIENGAAGSISVRTDSETTSYADGFLTMGAGTRVDADDEDVEYASLSSDPPGLVEFDPDVKVMDEEQLLSISSRSLYEPSPGALAEALPGVPFVVIGNSEWPRGPEDGPKSFALLTAMDGQGMVDFSFVSRSLLLEDEAAPFGVRADPAIVRETVSQALGRDCSVVILDGGDLIRREVALRSGETSVPIRQPLLDLDALVGSIREELDPVRDLLLIASPTSPLNDSLAHLGIAIAEGPGFEAGGSLTSASTGVDGIVTLADIAPTIIDHFGAERPEGMFGRSMRSISGDEGRVGSAVDLDEEARFAHRAQPLVSGVFAVGELILVLIAVWWLRRQKRRERSLSSWLEWGGLVFLSFPLAAFISTPLPAAELGRVGFGLVLALLSALIATFVHRIGRAPVRRLTIVLLATIVMFAVDLATGSRLQLTGVWGNDAILGGRFAGLSNIGFAVLGASAIALVGLFRDEWSGGRATTAALVVSVVAVVVDGAPGLGSDVGGVLALVPSLLLTWLLVTRGRVNLRALVLAGVISLVALALFAAVDLARPEEQQTHLARLIADVGDRGVGVFTDAVERKVDANLGVFGENPASFLIPPIFLGFARLVLRGKGRWAALRETHPAVAASLTGGLALAVIGFAVNDSGVVVMAVVMSVLAPLSLLMLLEVDRKEPA